MTLLEITNLKTYYHSKPFLFGPSKELRAVDGVSLSINQGEIYGLVGESGCGKSTLGRTVLSLAKARSGSVKFNGQEILNLSRQQMQPLRRQMQVIFQDPFGSLNPRMSVLEIIREPLDAHSIGEKNVRTLRVKELLDFVGLPKYALNRYPHEFSGGQRQRIGIARALALSPKFIVADEPVSALDVSIQAQILNLISDLRKNLGLSFLFIAHDLAVVQHISDRIGVMYLGKLVEEASSDELYSRPKHPYTQALLSAIPQVDPSRSKPHLQLKGDIPSPLAIPRGCAFHTRCPKALPKCAAVKPQLSVIGDSDHSVACHLYES